MTPRAMGDGSLTPDSIHVMPLRVGSELRTVGEVGKQMGESAPRFRGTVNRDDESTFADFFEIHSEWAIARSTDRMDTWLTDSEI